MNYIPLTFTFIGAVGAYSYFANKTFIAEDIPKVSKKKKKLSVKLHTNIVHSITFHLILLGNN